MKDNLIEILKQRYPVENSIDLSKDLNISIYQLRRLVQKHKIKKDNSFKTSQLIDLKEKRKLWYTRQQLFYAPTNIEENILVGSILGVGNLSRYGRSKEAHYREHGAKDQGNYRRWKSEVLSRLSFRFTDGPYPSIRSSSNKLYTHYLNTFYINEKKSITQENIKLLNHPIGLMCLYLDDGTLVIDSYRRKNTIHLFPRIALYTQSFTKEENIILLSHIKEQFQIEFKLKSRPDGYGYNLELNKRHQIKEFINLIRIEHTLLTCVNYKFNIEERLVEAKEKYQLKFPHHTIVNDSL